MNASVPPPVPPSNKTNVGVLKALLIFGAIVTVLGTVAYQFQQARADVADINQQTQERVQKSQEAVQRSNETRARCQQTDDC